MITHHFYNVFVDLKLLQNKDEGKRLNSMLSHYCTLGSPGRVHSVKFMLC